MAERGETSNVVSNCTAIDDVRTWFTVNPDDTVEASPLEDGVRSLTRVAESTDEHRGNAVIRCLQKADRLLER